MSEFQREERYIVIKRKTLDALQENSIRRLLRDSGISTVECVVVEHDWPNYEHTWGTIKQVFNGTFDPGEITALRQQLSDAKDGERMLWGFLEDKRQELEQVEIRAFALNECLAEVVNDMGSGDEPGAGLPWHTKAKQALSGIGRAIILRKQAEKVSEMADLVEKAMESATVESVHEGLLSYAEALNQQADEIERQEIEL